MTDVEQLVAAALQERAALRAVMADFAIVLGHPGLRSLRRSSRGRFALELQVSPLSPAPALWEAATIGELIAQVAAELRAALRPAAPAEQASEDGATPEKTP